MDLKEQVDNIRQKIEDSFDRKLKRLGLTEDRRREGANLDADQADRREENGTVLDVLEEEGQSYTEARQQLIEEFSFTFFNRIAALKVMGLRGLIPEPITRRSEHGGRSFAHKLWLEKSPPSSRRCQFGRGAVLCMFFSVPPCLCVPIFVSMFCRLCLTTKNQCRAVGITQGF